MTEVVPFDAHTPPPAQLPGPFSHFRIGDGVTVDPDVDLLGRGGFGSVWAVHSDRYPGVPLAIKFLSLPVVNWLREEAELALRFHHECIVRTFEFLNLRDAGVAPHAWRPEWPAAAIVMERYGTSLQRVFDSLRRKEEHLPAELALGYLQDVARGLHALHEQGWAHRDVKPSNVLVRLADDQTFTGRAASLAGSRAVLGDLGVAVRQGTVGALGLHDDGWKAPEVLDGRAGRGHYASPAQDVYAFGRIFEALETFLPPPAGPLDKARERLWSLAGLKRGCLRAAPEERPGAAALEAGLVGLPTRAVGMPRLEHGRLACLREELKKLTAWWEGKGEGKANVVCIVGAPGQSKTALALGLLRWARAHPSCGAERAFAWSFTEGPTEAFFEEALRWFASAARPTPGAGRAERLAEAVGRQRALLVLDGIDRFLRQPRSGGDGPVPLGDADLSALLTRLSQHNRGLCVVTSRAELAGFASAGPAFRHLRLSAQGPPPHRLLPGPLLTNKDVRTRVSALGQQIRADYQGGELTVVSVLTGSFIFTADLIRELDGVTVQVELVKAHSYHGTASGPLELDLALVDYRQIAGCDVLLVDDVLDTGQTLHTLVRRLAKHRPRSLKTAAFLRKRGRQRPDFPVQLDYVGFDIDDHFVVGYGLDYYGLYRNLSWVGVLEEQPSRGLEAAGGRTGGRSGRRPPSRTGLVAAGVEARPDRLSSEAAPARPGPLAPHLAALNALVADPTFFDHPRDRRPIPAQVAELLPLFERLLQRYAVGDRYAAAEADVHAFLFHPAMLEWCRTTVRLTVRPREPIRPLHGDALRGMVLRLLEKFARAFDRAGKKEAKADPADLPRLLGYRDDRAARKDAFFGWATAVLRSACVEACGKEGERPGPSPGGLPR
jgi:hypoxanthine phosphoribosyltransferase